MIRVNFDPAGVAPSDTDRAAAINEFGSAATTADVQSRARALIRVAENSTQPRLRFEAVLRLTHAVTPAAAGVGLAQFFGRSSLDTI